MSADPPAVDPSAIDASPPDPPDLDPLFDPDSVAVVGASPDSFYSGNLVDNLLSYGFEGDLHPVNPNRESAWGRRCYDGLGDVPGAVDLAVVSVPREHVPGVVRTAEERGIPAALVLSAGFGEADERGRELEAELRAVVADGDIRLCGPNCIGVADARAGVVLASTCSRRPEAGNVALVSQSGALAFTTFFERGADEDLGFSHVVSTGNEVDLSAGDYVAYLADREAVDVVCAYVEGVDDPRRFARAADDAVRSGTPVLTVKVGRADRADDATLSHTGSLTGDDDAWAAAFRGAGVERVPDVPDLLRRSRGHAAFDPPDGDRLCVASTSGGLASLLADMAEARGLALPPLDGDTERALLGMEELLTFGELHNPADVRGYGADALPEIADVLLADDGFDAYVFAVALSAVDERAERVADGVERIAERAEDPVFALWTGRTEPEAGGSDPLPYERLRRHLPLYYDPGRCLDAVASLVDAGERRRRRRERPSRRALEAAAEPRAIGLPVDAVLPWADAADLLARYDVPTAPTRRVESAGAAADAAAALGFPAVVKADAPALPHRTEAGAVRVGIGSAAAAAEAFEAVRAAAADRGVADAGALVQPELRGPEVLVGASREAGFGPVVTVGAGGTAVEALEDRAAVLPPCSPADARDALAETAVPALVEGHRGDDRSLDGLADLVARVGDLASEVGGVAELDCNPVVVTPSGPRAVDALVRTR